MAKNEYICFNQSYRIIQSTYFKQLNMNSKQEYIRLLSDFKTQRGLVYGITRIGIFGSVARGEQTEKSDVDIYYEGNPLSLFKIMTLKNELENRLNCTVDIVRLREKMNQVLKKRIQTEGIYV
ncbi:nucleotidyltransferase family protein [Sunxiuqinia dokdonensis]|uniref:Nucleotidyltransferase n=1 Tax=Sunxiuqinia dokdonensis TaxID=1409788 RepID=A0A0L8VG07_9BACT|nr:nucleotidyltransferase domain-containing protein [Sunxiuqinia dokdonensis]KOH47107.1 nucleotidyltransferase [Sunxiuqinia dokdonensis]